jgi:tRNA(fMet)-specific endonuclease VapC
VNTYLLDTNILSDLIHNPNGRVVAKIAEVGESAVATSIIVAAELRFGAQKKGSSRLSARVDAIINASTVLPLEPPADATYAELRAALESDSTPIGGNDMLIAAHAVALGRTLVTANVREFERVAGLEIVNWLEQ